jgi:signal transduction histidine kinase
MFQSTARWPDLHRAEIHFRRCLEKLPVGAYTCDRDGLITYYNEAAVKAWGRTPKLNDAVDRFCGSFRLLDVTGAPLKHEDCWMGLALRHQKEYAGEEIIIERPDGSRITVLAHASPIHNDEGELIGAVNVLVDIDEQKRASEAAGLAREAAEAMSRAKDRFLASLSHELRTPLSPVVMMLAAMEADPELPAKFHDDIVLIRRNVDLETKLIDDLLDVSRIISGKLHLDKKQIRTHDKLRHVLQNCVSDLFTRRLHVHTDFQATNDCFLGDAARFQQVFWNLLRNATKFTPEGGDITVRTWNEGTEHLCVEIRDTGVGIPPEVLPHIFDPFEQGEARMIRQFGGMGLGLAISKSIVELHGGTISATSEGRDKGATFLVKVPSIGPAMNEPSPQAKLAPVRSASGGARVLLVEDHADTALVLQRLLTRWGYHVQTASSVAAALQLSSMEPFDVVVSDIGLPDATGYDLMAALKQRGNVKGIAMSGYGAEEDLQKSQAAGFAEHLTKPVHMEQLEAALERLTGP